MRKVFLDNLPRKYRLGNEIIDWKNSIGLTIPFIYDNINDKFKIINYDGRKIYLIYNKDLKSIDRANLMENKIGKIITVDPKIITKDGYIDVSEIGNTKKGVDWTNSINKKIKFKCEKITGELKVLDYNSKNQQLKIIYNNKIFMITTQTLLMGKLKVVLGKRTDEYLYNTGDIINNVKIIDCVKIKNGKQVPRKGYRYKCLKCGYIGENSEGHFRGDRGICPVCCTPCRKVIRGINDIATTHPYLIKYFVNIEDAYKYSYSSNKKVLMICPDCGYKKKMVISQLYIYGFSCPKCSDGKSYGEKFVFNVLNQLHIKFEIEKEFEWSKNITYQNFKLNGNKRYDFFIPSINCIIETHGGQHYRYTGRGRSLELEQQNDRLKKELAIANGIKHEKYIVINTSNIDLVTIKQNLLNSQLSKIFNLNKINWNKCEEFALSNRVKEICIYWENGLHSTKDIAVKSKLSRGTVIRYLKIGSKINWCNYNPKKEIRSNSRKVGGKNARTIICLTTNEIFNSIVSAEKKYLLPKSKVSSCCKGERKSTGKHPITGEKLKWMYYEDYLKLHNKKAS
ncbi:hypothetical protein CF086_17420 [Clostridium botulinum]|uniref:zinc-ribbon domain-containing protein n=1 Tax=Clostridium botulinum TaxID=1491 RepID=UPI0007744C6A|nr:zinc-ribbon domain-containing protein [Clostridium botulinum]MBN3352078.1 hypothetical protein [Clostridium botulinum]